MKPLKQKKWLCAGDVGWDIYEGLNDEQKFPGGITLNHIVHLHKLGQVDVTFLGPLSQNSEDSSLENILKDKKIKILATQRELGMAPKQFIKVKQDGEKNFIRYEAGVLENYFYTRPQESFDFILLPLFSQNWSWARQLLTNPPRGRLVCDLLDGRDFDQNLELLKTYKSAIDLLVIGCPVEDDLFYQTLKENAGNWSRRQLVTRGSLEGFYFDGKKIYSFIPPEISKEKVIDSTGAGDAFLASFLFNLSQGAGPYDSLAKACQYASKQIQKLGPN